MYYKNADLKLKIMLLFATGAARSKRKIPRVGLHLYPIFIFASPVQGEVACHRQDGGVAEKKQSPAGYHRLSPLHKGASLNFKPPCAKEPINLKIPHTG